MKSERDTSGPHACLRTLTPGASSFTELSHPGARGRAHIPASATVRRGVRVQDAPRVILAGVLSRLRGSGHLRPVTRPSSVRFLNSRRDEPHRDLPGARLRPGVRTGDGQCGFPKGTRGHEDEHVRQRRRTTQSFSNEEAILGRRGTASKSVQPGLCPAQ